MPHNVAFPYNGLYPLACRLQLTSIFPFTKHIVSILEDMPADNLWPLLNKVSPLYSKCAIPISLQLLLLSYINSSNTLQLLLLSYINSSNTLQLLLLSYINSSNTLQLLLLSYINSSNTLQLLLLSYINSSNTLQLLLLSYINRSNTAVAVIVL